LAATLHRRALDLPARLRRGRPRRTPRGRRQRVVISVR
jgi:hypothetical protein